MAESAQQSQLRERQRKLQLQEQQDEQQKAPSSAFSYTTTPSTLYLCGVTILLLCSVCGLANGNGNINGAGNHNYTTLNNALSLEQRTRRDVAAAQQSTLVPNVNDDPKDINGNKEILASQSIDVEQNYDSSPFRELNIIKRAPSGFVGMRGKKDSADIDEANADNTDDDSNAKSLDWDIDPLYQAKLRNNKNADDDVVSEYEDAYDAYGNSLGRFKKAPTAFYGVRGKKLPNHNGNGYNNLNEMLRELQEEHLREIMLQDFIGRLAVATAAQNEITKRAPTGFTGLRGKRRSVDWYNGDDVGGIDGTGKRAPANSFVGVRGKKDVVDEQQMSPETLNDEHQNLFKRSPAESFGGGGGVGSGKRRFSDFNNKFVAVRGKKEMLNSPENGKTSSAANHSYQMRRQRLAYLRNVLPALVYGNVGGVSSFKRAPSGFIGMRGKREANDVMPQAASYLSTNAA